MKVYAIILLSGESYRFGTDVPKQFIQLKDKLLFQYSVEAFEGHPLVDNIVLVVHPSYLGLVNGIVKNSGYEKVKSVVQGGKTRQLSSYQGISQITGEDSIVLIHDAARPFVSETIISECIKQLAVHSAVSTCINVTDTLYLHEDLYIIEIPDRGKFLRAQTPQGFRLKIILEAHQLALKEEYIDASDDCSLIVKYLAKERIYCVAGEDKNIKITYKLDEEIARYLIERSNKEIESL